MDQDVIDNYPVTPAKKTLPKWFKDLPQEKFSFPIGNILPTIKKLALNYKNYEIDDIGTSAFISDLTSMYHETLNNRIYQT